MPKGRKKGSTYVRINANKREYIIRRFRKRYIVDIDTGCWLWTGKPTFDGYGGFYMYGKPCPAHRASYILFVKEVPDGLMVCHCNRCKSKLCVNPNHLYAGTHQHNMRDLRKSGVLKGQNNPNYGIQCSDEKREKIKNGVKVWIENNPEFDTSIYTSKNWTIRKPDGKILQIKNLSKFCRENNLSLSSEKSGFYIVNKGWSIQRREND